MPTPCEPCIFGLDRSASGASYSVARYCGIVYEARSQADSASHFFIVIIIVIRHETTAATPWASLLIVRTFSNDAFTIAVWTGFHVYLSVALSSHYASRGPCNNPRVSISDIEYEIEAGVKAVASIGYPHQQFALK
jgi:hypothetical protein